MKTQQLSNTCTPSQRAARALDVIDANVAILDNQGFIIATNKAWRDFAANNRLTDGSLPQAVGLQTNYLKICQEASGESSENGIFASDGIKAILDGKKKVFCLEYSCHSPLKKRWFIMKVKPLPRSSPREAVVIHIDITDRRLAEMESFSKQKELGAALAQLQLMASQISNTLSQEVANQAPQAASPLQAPATQQNRPPSEPERLKSLSKRELEIFRGLVHGERNVDMASRLQLSKKSVSTYRSRVLEKLKIENDAQLIAFAHRGGLL